MTTKEFDYPYFGQHPWYAILLQDKFLSYFETLNTLAKAPSPHQELVLKSVLVLLLNELDLCRRCFCQCNRLFYLWIRPLPSPAANFSTSATVTILKSPSIECFSADAATANSTACWVVFPLRRL